MRDYFMSSEKYGTNRVEFSETEENELIDTFSNLLSLSRVPLVEGKSVYRGDEVRYFDENEVMNLYFSLQSKGIDKENTLMTEIVWPEKMDVSWKRELIDLREYVVGNLDKMEQRTMDFLASIGLTLGKMEEMRSVFGKRGKDLISDYNVEAKNYRSYLQIVIDENIEKRINPDKLTRESVLGGGEIKKEKTRSGEVDIDYIIEGEFFHDLKSIYSPDGIKAGRDVFKSKVKEKIPGFVVMSKKIFDHTKNKEFFRIEFEEGQRLAKNINDFMISYPGKKLEKWISTWQEKWQKDGTMELLEKSNIKWVSLVIAKRRKELNKTVAE